MKKPIRKQPGYIASSKKNTKSSSERKAISYILCNMGYSVQDTARLIAKSASNVHRYYNGHILQYKSDEAYRDKFDTIIQNLPKL